MSQFRNLPGVNMNIEDGNLRLTENNALNSVLIIADVNAPTNLEVPEGPVLVTNEVELREKFGNFFHQGKVNPIAQEWYIAKQAGVRNIYLLALSGDAEADKFTHLQDMLFNVVADLSIEHVILTGMYADQDIEGIEINEDVESGEGVIAYYKGVAIVEAPASVEISEGPENVIVKVQGKEISLPVEETQKVEDLIDSLNKSFKVALQEQSIEEEIVLSLEENKVVSKSTTEIVYEEGTIATALGLAGLELNLQGHANAAVLLGQFAEMQSNQARAVLGYIGVAPVETTNLVDIRNQVDRLAERNNDISKNVQVVAGPPAGVILPGNTRMQWTTGVTQYAGLVNRLAPQVAPTNQTLPGVAQLRYNLSLRQLDKLVGNKYVTFQLKNNRISVVDGVTTAPDLSVGQDVMKSDFTRLSTLRTINYLSRRVYEEMDGFIGQPYDLEIYNAMNTAIKSVIRSSIENAIIQDARYSIELGDSFDTSIIHLSVLPQFELRKINVSIGLSTPENFDGGLANRLN